MTVAFRSTGSTRKGRARQASAGTSSKVTPLVPRQSKGIEPTAIASGWETRSPQGNRVRNLRGGLTETATKAGKKSVNSATRQTRSNPWAVPFWVRSLLKAQTVSSVVTFLLVAGALFIYGSTVYYQQQWGTSFRKLEHLRRLERKLSATNETLKTNLAQQAENPANGLVPPNNLDNMIFLEPTPVKTSAPVDAVGDREEPNPGETRPVGY